MRKKAAMHVLYGSVLLCFAVLVGCPLRRLTGLRCPFCGMTRAHRVALRGDFAAAFAYHPLFPLGIPFVLGVAHLYPLKKHRVAFAVDIAMLTAICAALAVRYVYMFR